MRQQVEVFHLGLPHVGQHQFKNMVHCFPSARRRVLTPLNSTCAFHQFSKVYKLSLRDLEILYLQKLCFGCYCFKNTPNPKFTKY